MGQGTNPFYIEPATANIQPVLDGLGSLIKENREAKKKAAIEGELMAAVESGDPMQMAEISIKYPQYQEATEKAFGFANPSSKKAAMETYRRVLSDPENAELYFSEGIDRVTAARGKPDMMTRDRAMFRENPEAALKAVKAGYAGVDGPGYKSLFGEGGTGAMGLASAKTVILDSGATIQALPNKQVEVRNPSGEIVTGQARLDVLEEDRIQRQTQLQNQADRTVNTARRVEQVKKASETASKAFDMVDKIKLNIDNLRQVTPLIGQGANTGPIDVYFPSFKKETIELENLQKRLGLDVVGATTFGALSKGELDLAKAVALPLNLQGDALIEWVNKAIAAKEKLATYYEDQAIFLSQGNTQGDWLKMKKDELKATMGDATEGDIRQAMRDNNMTRPQVLAEMKRKNTGQIEQPEQPPAQTGNIQQIGRFTVEVQ